VRIKNFNLFFKNFTANWVQSNHMVLILTTEKIN